MSIRYHPIIVRQEPAGQFAAEPLGVPEIRTVAETAQEAIEQARQALSRWPGSLAWVRLSGLAPNALASLPGAGHAKDDPDFDIYLQEIERYRREVDERECSSSSSTPTT